MADIVNISNKLVYKHNRLQKQTKFENNGYFFDHTSYTEYV